MLLDLDPGGNIGNPILNGGGAWCHTNRTDYRRIVHLEFKFKPGPPNDSREDECSHRRAPGIYELQIEVEPQG